MYNMTDLDYGFACIKLPPVITDSHIGGRGDPPDKSDPRTPNVSDNRAYMGIIAGYMGIYCHICIQVCPLGRGGIQGF